jgi:uncharacterized membrane protein
MAGVKERITPKTRVESLSDLIFGLALSIGALTLIGQPPTNVLSLILSILYYAFSFLIIINVWFGYTGLMANLHVETKTTLYLNIMLLFLVSIEPYLFNQLFNSVINTQYVSVLYAFDLGGLFLVQAYLSNIVSQSKTLDIRRHYKLMRNSLLIGAALFFISVIPIFWSIVIPLGNDTYLRLTLVIWLIPLFQRSIRHLWEKRRGKNQKPLT